MTGWLVVLSSQGPGSLPVQPRHLLLPTPLLPPVPHCQGPTSDLAHSGDQTVAKTVNQGHTETLSDIGCLSTHEGLPLFLPLGQVLLLHPLLRHEGDQGVDWIPRLAPLAGSQPIESRWALRAPGSASGWPSWRNGGNSGAHPSPSS